MLESGRGTEDELGTKPEPRLGQNNLKDRRRVCRAEKHNGDLKGRDGGGKAGAVCPPLTALLCAGPYIPTSYHPTLSAVSQYVYFCRSCDFLITGVCFPARLAEGGEQMVFDQAQFEFSDVGVCTYRDSIASWEKITPVTTR